MSYILDALKKSDQQRQRGATPTLLTVPAAMAEPGQPAALMYGVLAVALVGAGIAIGWLRPWQAEQAPPAADGMAAQPVIRSAARPPDSSPRQWPEAVASALPEALSEPGQAPRMQRKAAVAPARAVPAPSTQKTVEAVEIKSTDPAPDQGVVATSELPFSVRQELPKMQISLHVYSQKPEDRLVSINDRLLREGDSAAPGVRLEAVTPDGMIFSFQGYRFRRGVK